MRIKKIRLITGRATLFWTVFITGASMPIHAAERGTEQLYRELAKLPEPQRPSVSRRAHVRRENSASSIRGAGKLLGTIQRYLRTVTPI